MAKQRATETHRQGIARVQVIARHVNHDRERARLMADGLAREERLNRLIAQLDSIDKNVYDRVIRGGRADATIIIGTTTCAYQTLGAQ